MPQLYPFETDTLPYVNQIAAGNLLNDAGKSNPTFCDNLEGWGSWKESYEDGTHVCLWLIR